MSNLLDFKVTSPGLPFIKDVNVLDENSVEVEFEFHGEKISGKNIEIFFEQVYTKKGVTSLEEAGVEIVTEKKVFGKNHTRIIFRFMRKKAKKYYFNFVAKVRNSAEEYHFRQRIEFVNP